jgi:hypothetical protein
MLWWPESGDIDAAEEMAHKAIHFCLVNTNASLGLDWAGNGAVSLPPCNHHSGGSKMNIYHDWEFLEDGETIKPISVGMVRDGGSSYYAVFAGAPWFAIHQNTWLMQNVYPYLSPDGGPLDLLADYVKSKDEIRLDIGQFIVTAPGTAELWADYGAYDHVCLAQLWGKMIDLPPYVPMHTNDLQTLIRLSGLLPSDMPTNRLGSHNALSDAHNLRADFEFLRAFRRRTKYADRQELLSAAKEGRWVPPYSGR